MSEWMTGPQFDALLRRAQFGAAEQREREAARADRTIRALLLAVAALGLVAAWLAAELLKVSR